MPAKVQVALTPSQRQFANLNARFALYCAGKGTGKSYLMGFLAVTDALHCKDATIGVYEPDYDKIRRVAVPSVKRWLEEFGIKYIYNSTTHDIFTSSLNCGNFIFKSMNDPESLVGYQTYRQHIDELDTMSTDKAEEAFIQLLGRNRLSPNKLPKEHKIFNEDYGCWEAFNSTRVYTSPEGFKFCYKNWVENKQPGFEMVKGCTLENTTLPKGHIQSLYNIYTEAQARAYIYGEFVNFDSGTVYYCYDPIKHDSNEEIREGDTLRIGMDFNVRKMAATIYIVRGDKWHAVEELFDILDTPTIIKIIKDRWQDKGHEIIIYPDASGTSNSAMDASGSNIALLQQAGFKIRAHRKNAYIKDRVLVTNKAFEDMRVFVNKDKCSNASKCLIQQTYGKDGKPDKNSSTDHPNDATTYPIEYEMGINNQIVAIPYHYSYKRFA